MTVTYFLAPCRLVNRENKLLFLTTAHVVRIRNRPCSHFRKPISSNVIQSEIFTRDRSTSSPTTSSVGPVCVQYQHRKAHQKHPHLPPQRDPLLLLWGQRTENIHVGRSGSRIAGFAKFTIARLRVREATSEASEPRLERLVDNFDV